MLELGAMVTVTRERNQANYELRIDPGQVAVVELIRVKLLLLN